MIYAYRLLISGWNNATPKGEKGCTRYTLFSLDSFVEHLKLPFR